MNGGNSVFKQLSNDAIGENRETMKRINKSVGVEDPDPDSNYSFAAKGPKGDGKKGPKRVGPSYEDMSSYH
jgi:hypothetical protein